MRPRSIRFGLVTLGLAGAASVLAACAGSTQLASDTETYNALQAKCEAGGGRFVTTGRLTGRPGLDNACKSINPTQGGPASSFDPG